MSYTKKLTSPLWQKKRLDVLNRDSFTCQLCSDTGIELHVHHKEYITGREPWEYEDEYLITLCKHCHAVVEHNKECDVIAVSKKYISDDSYYALFCISNYDGELRLTIMRYDTTLSHIIGLKKSTLTELSTLFENTEKLLPVSI